MISINMLFVWLVFCCSVHSTRAYHCAKFGQHPGSRVYRDAPIVSPGRVKDIDEWILLSSDSLEKATGNSLVDYMEGVDSLQHIHSNARYAVLSHGNQTDPIYNYFNKGALQQFEWPESEIYSLPSRYSAPDGALRRDRARMMATLQQQDVQTIPIAIRQTKRGKQFQIQNVLLWNVYDSEGVRLGQTALFDRSRIAFLSEVS